MCLKNVLQQLERTDFYLSILNPQYLCFCGTNSCQYLQVTSTHLYQKLLLDHTPHGKCERIQTLKKMI